MQKKYLKKLIQKGICFRIACFDYIVFKSIDPYVKDQKNWEGLSNVKDVK